MIKKLLPIFAPLIKGLADKAAQDALFRLQKALDYCTEENQVLRELVITSTGKVRITLDDSQRRRLAVKAIEVGKHILGNITTLFQPDTILGWHRTLVAQKYDSSSSGRQKSGRPPVSAEIIKEVLRVAKINTSWGYDKIVGVLDHIKLIVSRSTVKRILDDNGIVPIPELKRRVQWKEFIKSHMDVLAATDFFSIELLTPRGLVKCMVMFIIDIKTRRVEISGITTNPTYNWMKQMARNATDCFDGVLKDKRYFIRDRDPLFNKDFDSIIESAGVTVKKLPRCSPNMNAYAERFVQTIKHECLDKLILTSQKQLEYVVREFMIFYHRERPHQGLGNKIIDPWPQDDDGKIVQFERLGGLLRSYRRVA